MGAVGMLRFTLAVLMLATLAGCDGDGSDLVGDDLTGDDMVVDDVDGGDLSGEWIRVGYADCEGTLPLQELPVERDFIFTHLLTVEQNGDRLTLSIAGRWVGNPILIGTLVFFESAYSASIDADPPLRYAEISASRQGEVLDDGRRLTFQDHYESYGDFLVCRHEFVPA